MRSRGIVVLMTLGLALAVLLVFRPWEALPVRVQPEDVNKEASILLSGRLQVGVGADSRIMLAFSEEKEEGRIAHLFLMLPDDPSQWSDFPNGPIENASLEYSPGSISVRSQGQSVLAAGFDNEEHMVLALSHAYGDLGATNPEELLEAAAQDPRHSLMHQGGQCSAGGPGSRACSIAQPFRGCAAYCPGAQFFSCCDKSEMACGCVETKGTKGS